MKTLVLILCFFAHAMAGIENCYKKLEHKLGSSGLEGVDYIYLINLDQRTERLANSFRQLAPYGIFFERFPGIYGWTLSPATLNEMALKFNHGMWTGYESVMHFPPDGDGTYQMISLSGAWYGKSCFSGWTVKGTIGCTLSHLSVLKDAYDSGYETIWILEDDFVLVDNPHKLSGLLKELDTLVKDWDALYTDFDYRIVDKTKDLRSQIPLLWRPDMPFFNIQTLIEHHDMGPKFLKIGSRNRAHSIIYSRRGIKKILDFYKAHDNFLPFDEEIALIPGIQLYVVKDPIVSVHEVTSDTRYKYFP